MTIKVKPLVWKWYRDPRDTSEARTQVGTWTAWEINGSGYWRGSDDICGRPVDGGIETAKAAAQADYDARALAAIPEVRALLDEAAAEIERLRAVRGRDMKEC